MEGRAIAIVGVGAVLPDAPDAITFWQNIKTGRYSITDVTPDRWDSNLYYDADPGAPDKTYSKIGGWVRDYVWDPLKWRMPIPPRVAASMDGTQRFAVACTREALADYGYPQRTFDAERTAVILGNAMAGEMHYLTAIRAYMPEYANQLADSESFAALPESTRNQILSDFRAHVGHKFPEITEDTMPGELSNCIAGRIANLFNFHGPNYVVDAACASAMAALSAAVEGLEQNEFDLAVTGGIDRNMGPSTFIKFCKIGALSATGSRPYAEGADGFVMGEGGAILLLKRLADAERDGDKIYAVLRGIAGASDGKGKGITAPNPIGQRLSIERAWQNACLSPATATLVEGHGTSTKVGDVVEVQSLIDVLNTHHLPQNAVALGSVKSNIGHLKAAAGAAGLLKTVFALRHKVLPPSVKFERPNPAIDFAHSPLYVNTDLKEWNAPKNAPRRAGVSAFGFGGTNFHAVLEEYIPGQFTTNGKHSVAVTAMPPISEVTMMAKHSVCTGAADSSLAAPLRGALLIGADTEAQLIDKLRNCLNAAEAGVAPSPALPLEEDLRAPERLAIDFADAAELAAKAAKALKAMEDNKPSAWRQLSLKGVFRGSGPAQKIAFLFTGQGSQYVNMLRPFRASAPIVAKTFAEADDALTPLLGKPLSHYIFVDDNDPNAVAKAEEDLRQTAITQPAVLATDVALARMLSAFGVQPDMTMGHSLGEYGALVASGVLPFHDALEAVSARGREMTRVSMGDNGRMAAVSGPIADIEKILNTIDGYVVIANINSDHQAVIGGASAAVEQAMQALQKAGFACIGLQVSHAFHTSIVAPAGVPLRTLLDRLDVRPPNIPVIANVTGEFYPSGPGARAEIINILARQVESPVQFVKGLHTLYNAGARVFVEVGPKKALHSFAEDVLSSRGDVLALYTNHPKIGDVASFNQALCGLYAAGHGRTQPKTSAEVVMTDRDATARQQEINTVVKMTADNSIPATPENGDRYRELGKVFADAMQRGWKIFHEDGAHVEPAAPTEPMVITGAGLGLPGTEHIFDDTNVERILRGDQFIDSIPMRFRHAMLDKNVTRLVKSETGGPNFETIHDIDEVIKLAGRGGQIDMEKEYGLSAERLAALDRVTQLAIGAGLDAMRDAGIPLVLRYKKTTKGTLLPDRWGLPDCMRDDTGVIFASAFPGYDSLVDQVSRYQIDRARHEELTSLQKLLTRAMEANSPRTVVDEIQHKIDDLQATLERDPYLFDRRFLFRTLSMGHSQFAEFIGARGPNTAINSACATTTQALSLAEDWIRAGRCNRVIIIAADDVTSDNMMEWIGAGFLATGAAATDETVENAAIPFDKRRHGMIIGMGAAALIAESAEAARERGVRPICELLSSVTANSAFHGTRLDVQHICDIMEKLIVQAEKNARVDRFAIAPQMMFMSHETYTPARGGSASAEINALRRVFGKTADHIVIANTKGFTGHAMACGIEDIVAVKSLETGCVPPVANFKEVDPDLGSLNLSKGGVYPVEYALRLAAGFGSQVSMTLMRWVKSKDGTRPSASGLGYAYRIADPEAWNQWLQRVSGRPGADLEVVKRTLRVRDIGVAAMTAAASTGSATTTPPQVAAPKTITQKEAPPVPKPEILQAIAEPVQLTTITSTTTAVAVAPKDVNTEAAIKQRVLALVAEKTGYPVDMLDLDLDLEADLGIDTVKQAEVFAAVREIYNIPRDETRKLRDYPTLSHVIQFVVERTTTGGNEPPSKSTVISIESPVQAPKSTGAPAGASTPDTVEDKLLDIVSQKTGYPKDMLDLELDLEADLGIDTVKQAEIFATIRELYDIPRDENRKLRDYPTLAHVIRFVHERRPQSAVPNAASAEPPAVQPVTPPPAAQPPSIPLAVAPTSDETVKQTVLDIVAEKTGYPKDMLDVELDLEADLGIDTVKQAEMFAAVRAAYDIPRDEHLKLRDFPTLEHVIRFAQDRQKQASIPANVPEPKRPTGDTKAKARPSVAAFEATNRIPRRVPMPVPRPPLSLCKLTPVKLGSGSRVVIMPDTGGVAAELERQLRQLNVEVLVAGSAPDLASQLKTWMERGSIQGVFWLPALDPEAPISQMSPSDWHQAVQLRLKSLYLTMRTLYERVSMPGTFLVSATRLGGQHGYDAAGAIAPLGGAVAGFTKTYKRERPDSTCKVVDFAIGLPPSEIAETLIAETLRDPGAVEIGYKHSQRWTVGLRESPAEDGNSGMVLDQNSVFVVTGAAGSIVSAITADLAIASGGTFYLLDLVPQPDPNNPDLKRFITDKDALKRDIFNRIQAKGERATPVLVEKELAALERACAAQSAIDAVRIAGGTAHYFSVNLTDPDSVANVVNKIRQQSGHIDVLLHAAGIERSHFLPDKDVREFDLVFDVKCDGWFNLMHAIGDMPLGATVAFSSIAGRFGNAGQTDYSSANDLLCKFTSQLRSTRPTTRGIAIDWTAWGGIGMATRGSIPKMMEVAGIDMLPPEAGIPLIRRELTTGGTRGEIVIGQRLGSLLNEWDATGGLDVNAVSKDAGPMLGKVLRINTFGELLVETTLDPQQQPFLRDHQIDSTSVLPGVMGIEAFAEAATAILPGWHVDSVENIDFLAPFKFYRNQPRTLTIAADLRAKDDSIIAECRLSGTRQLPNQPEPQETTHFTARVRLTRTSPRAVDIAAPVESKPALQAEEIYRIYFHGPAYRVLDRAWIHANNMIGVMAMPLPPNHLPPTSPTLMAPRVLELCFQTASLWQMTEQDVMGLPQHVDEVRLIREPGIDALLYAIVGRHNEYGFDVDVVDNSGTVYLQLRGYRTVAVPITADLRPLQVLRTEVSALALASD